MGERVWVWEVGGRERERGRRERERERERFKEKEEKERKSKSKSTQFLRSLLSHISFKFTSLWRGKG